MVWTCLTILAVSCLTSALMWSPKQDPYPEAGGSASANTAQLRRRPALGAYAADDIELVVQPSWPDSSVKFGQVAAVSVDQDGQVIVFHRGSHVWDGDSFDTDFKYMQKEKGPVTEDTVVVLDPHSGVVLKSWGKGIFFMPHGLSIDHEGNLWVTDVALHQIFKFPPLATLHQGVTDPLMVKGERFVNGKDDEHFCQPSAVAVLSNGDFFVSDGYCNSRIIKFDKNGLRLMTWGRSSFTGNVGVKPGPYQFNIPHALTLAEDRNLVCAADRENGRVQCFYSHNGTFVYEIASESFGTRLFSVAYTPTKGGLFYLVNGPQFIRYSRDSPVQGFIVDANNLKIVSTFRPGNNSDLSNPHDIAVSPDGESVYVAQLDPARTLKFVHKGDISADKQATTKANVNQSSPIANVPSSLASSSQPTAKTMEVANSTAALPVGLNLMANSSFAKAMTTPLVAITSLMVILLCVMASGIVWYMQTRQRAYPAIPNEGFNLGHLLASHSRRGFEQVSTEESDDDRAESDQPA